ncbi:MAG: hypothetical protein RL518_1187 [Pseudomonadota bacterium]
MVPLQPDDSPEKRPNSDPLKGSSIHGVERVSFAGLERGSHDYAKALVSLCLLVHARRVVVMDDSAKSAVRDLDIFEWSCPYPDGVRARPFPYFPGDQGRHDELARFEGEYVRLKRAEIEGELFKGTFRSEYVHPNTPTTYAAALALVEQSIHEVLDGLRRRSGRGIAVPEGRMRATDFGDLLIPLIHNKPTETGALIFRIVMRAEDAVGKVYRRPIVEHIHDLWEVAGETQPNRGLRLQCFNRHVRKLGVAILEGEHHLAREDLVERSKRILAEGHVDTYLSNARTKAQQQRHQQAYRWLQGWAVGQHGSVPYPSWQPTAKKESFEESFKIVTRARHHSYHSFGRLRMETRSLGGRLPLFREFAMDCFEDVRFIRCDNTDMPPGRGTFMSGAILDKLFHSLSPNIDVLHEYRKDPHLWFADQLNNLEICSIVALRQWIGVTAPSDDFTLFKDRYYYVIDNDHFSGSYGFAFGFPASVINTKVRQASYTLDEGPEVAMDAAAAKLSIPELIQATKDAGKNHLVLGHMSPLFGGMCNALPVASKPVFAWEVQHQSTAWRDVYGHVHWPWLINSFRRDRERVDDAVRPLAKADLEIRNFATSGQKLFEAFRHRYGAWKNDLTPGDMAPPRMLVRAYEIYREHQRKGSARKGDETIFIGAIDRSVPEFDPIPLLNCFSLELSSRHIKYKAPLPRRGDGTGRAEQAVWRKHVAPLIELRTRQGEAFEGPYELVIIGENDIKRN